MTRRVLVAFLCLAFGSPPAHSTESPARFYLRNPFLTQVRLSPSGKYLASLIERGDKQTIIVRETAGSKLIPVVRNEDSEWRIAQLEWVTDDRLVFWMATRLHAKARPARRWRWRFMPHSPQAFSRPRLPC